MVAYPFPDVVREDNMTVKELMDRLAVMPDLNMDVRLITKAVSGRAQFNAITDVFNGGTELGALVEIKPETYVVVD